MRERLIGKQVESCTLWALQARSEEQLKHSCRWLLFEQLLLVPKHVTLSQKMRLALLVSILIEIKWGTLMRPQIRYATWIPLAIPTLTWGSRDPKSYQFYTDQSCSKMVGHISQEYELTKTQTNKKGVFHSVSILERTTVRQKCSLVALELEVATSC